MGRTLQGPRTCPSGEKPGSQGPPTRPHTVLLPGLPAPPERPPWHPCPIGFSAGIREASAPDSLRDANDRPPCGAPSPGVQHCLGPAWLGTHLALPTPPAWRREQPGSWAQGLTEAELGSRSSLFTSAWVSSRNHWVLANRREKVAGFTATRATLQEPVETDTPAVPAPWPHRPALWG